MLLTLTLWKTEEPTMVIILSDIDMVFWEIEQATKTVSSSTAVERHPLRSVRLRRDPPYILSAWNSTETSHDNGIYGLGGLVWIQWGSVQINSFKSS